MDAIPKPPGIKQPETYSIDIPLKSINQSEGQF